MLQNVEILGVGHHSSHKIVKPELGKRQVWTVLGCWINTSKPDLLFIDCDGADILCVCVCARACVYVCV